VVVAKGANIDVMFWFAAFAHFFFDWK